MGGSRISIATIAAMVGNRELYTHNFRPFQPFNKLQKRDRIDVMRTLSTTEYDSLLLAGLVRMGISEDVVRTLLAARWPMFDISLLAEAQGRGLTITVGDVQAFLDSLVQGTDVSPPDARQSLFMPSTFDTMLTWLVSHGRGKPTIVGELMQERPRDLRAMLESSTAAAGRN